MWIWSLHFPFTHHPGVAHRPLSPLVKGPWCTSIDPSDAPQKLMRWNMLGFSVHSFCVCWSPGLRGGWRVLEMYIKSTYMHQSRAFCRGNFNRFRATFNLCFEIRIIMMRTYTKCWRWYLYRWHRMMMICADKKWYRLLLFLCTRLPVAGKFAHKKSHKTAPSPMEWRICEHARRIMSALLAFQYPVRLVSAKQRENWYIFRRLCAHLSGQDVVILPAIRTHAGMLFQLLLGFWAAST